MVRERLWMGIQQATLIESPSTEPDGQLMQGNPLKLSETNQSCLSIWKECSTGKNWTFNWKQLSDWSTTWKNWTFNLSDTKFCTSETTWEFDVHFRDRQYKKTRISEVHVKSCHDKDSQGHKLNGEQQPLTQLMCWMLTPIVHIISGISVTQSWKHLECKVLCSCQESRKIVENMMHYAVTNGYEYWNGSLNE